MTDDDIAYTAAINVLLDTIESRRLPSGLPLEADAAALHERAVRHLEHMRAEHRRKIHAANQAPT
jgi:hypothetical protein